MNNDFQALLARILNQQQQAPVPQNKPSILPEFLNNIEPGGFTHKMPRGIRNNNPGNIRDYGDKWQGMLGAEKVSNNPNEPGFVKFKSPEFGIRALSKDLQSKYNRGLNTIEKIVAAYAPPNENDTQAYIKSVSQKTGFKPSEKLNLKDKQTLKKLVTAKIFHENGVQPYSNGIIDKGINLSFT